MKIGIGIDTGGTYTDAVIYDFDSDRILASAKALTTREDLTVGITNALDGLGTDYLTQAKFVSLSTTLATNACVENKGGRAKLLLIGVDPKVVDWVGREYGLKNEGELYFCGNKGSFDGTVIDEPDWDALIEDTREWLHDADGLGIVEIYATNNGAVCEKRGKAAFERVYDFPVVCGYELFSDRNSVQRGSSTLLNAKLVPVIREFLISIRKAMDSRKISAPILIVRSDATLMSEEFSRLRPVETILCGPAASVLGGTKLTDEKNSIIVDIGGTTTDISLVKDGMPVTVKNGVSIGQWRTFVKGVFIDTFALGGDSAVRLKDNAVSIDARRVVPLSVAAARWPSIVPGLRALLESGKVHTLPFHEFFYLVREISDRENYSEQELAFCDALRKKPLSFCDAAEAVDADIYRMNTERLETEGIVMRCGMTPTDVMHLRGDFNQFNADAARLGAEYMAQCIASRLDIEYTVEQFCDDVYDLVKKTLYQNIVRILLQDKYPAMRKEGIDSQLETMIDAGWESAKHPGTNPYLDFGFHTESTLVGIGAPTHIFLPDVAKALKAKCIIPEYAGVANAIGAIAGKVTAVSRVEIRPNTDFNMPGGFTVFGKEGNCVTEELEEAIRIAGEQAAADAKAEAIRRGAFGEITIRTKVDAHTGYARGHQEIDLGTTVTATAFGGITV